MTKVKELASKKAEPSSSSAGASLVKELLSKSLSKGGKLKAIKVKAKFGNDTKTKEK